MASLAALQAARASLIDQISSLQAVISVNQRSLQRLEGNLPFARTEQERTALQGQITSLRGQIATDQAKLPPLNAQLAEIDAQIAALARQQGARESSGETVKEEQVARSDLANNTNPPTGPLVNQAGQATTPQPAVPNNAQRYQQSLTVGTNGRVRPPSETQAIPVRTAAPGAASPNNFGSDADAQPGGFYGAFPSQERGVGAPSDDATSTGNQTRNLLNQIFGSQQKIIAQDNPLDKYASYTYNISIYLMSPSQLKKMQATKQKNIAGFQLLMQSGGAPTSSGETVAVDPQEIEQDADGISTTNLGLRGLGRNQFFPLDFYIEDLRLKSIVQGRGSRASHNVFEMNFKVIEPNGISLLDRLYAATAQYMPSNPECASQKNYAAQNYLMVIRFYGYDENGNLVRPQALRKQAGVSDADSIIEKWIPFQFTGIRFRIANRLTEYECSAVCPQNVIATGQARGVIPYNVELNAVTLSDLLTGRAGFSTPQQIGATDGRQTSNTTQETAAQIDARLAARYGLPAVGADVDFERSLSAPGSTPGTFGTIEELNNVLGLGGDASVNAGGSPTQNSAPPKAGTATKTIVSGLVDALNQYQRDKVDAKELQYPDVYEIVFKDPTLAQAKLVPEGLINKKNTPSIQTTDPAQKLLGSKQSLQVDAQTKSILAGTSIVQFLDLVTRNSTYMTEQQTYIIDARTGERRPNGRPADTVGWFSITTQIEPLQYDCIRKDYAYKITYVIGPYAVVDTKTDWFPQSVFRGTQKKYSYWFTGENTQVIDYYQDYNYMYYLVVNGPTAPKVYTDRREFDKAAFQTAAGETNQGQENNVYGPVATLADVLYSPADTARGKLTIVGDPDWIQQGPLWAGAVETNYDYRAFLIDGTINYESQEPLFEVLFNQPVDYNLSTGLLDPERSRFASDDGVGMQAKTSYIYRAITVTSTFSRGRFTQELEGAQVFFPIPNPQKSDANRSVVRVEETGSRTGVPTLSGSEYTNFRKQEIAAQNAGVKVTDWNTGYANAYATGASQTSMAAQLAASATAPNTTILSNSPPPTPPTSGTEVVGPAASGTSAVRSQGGAAGPANIGPPSTFIILKTGTPKVVTSQEEIRSLVTSGQATSFEGGLALRALSAQQTAANSPQTSAPPLKNVRET
jgi:hypothetical protein